MSFNLLTEPWLPVRWRDGSPPTEVGLREALLRSPEIVELTSDNPLETASLNRLLLALVASAYPALAQEEDWAECWRSGRFDEAGLDAYLTEYADRFDLLSPKRPFFGHPNPEAKDPSPLTRLLHAAASGNNATLFSHDLDGQAQPLSLAAAARAVVCTQTAALGGGVAKPFNFCHAPLVGSAFFWLRGRPGDEAVLFGALLLNLPPTPSVWGEGKGKDIPAWEPEHPPTPEKRDALGLRDLLTFQSRRLRLATDGNGQATGVYYNQGSKLEKLPFDDPFLAYQVGKEGPYPLRFSVGKALWRDSAAFLMASACKEGRDKGAHPPRTFDWLAVYGERIGLEKDAHLEADVFGLVNDQAKVELWRQERVTVYPEIIRDADRWNALDNALVQATQTSRLLRDALKAFAARARLGKAFGSRLGDVERRELDEFVRALDGDNRYWPALGSRFNDLLYQLATSPIEGLAEVRKKWQEAVRSVARASLAAALEPYAQDARTWQALAEAETVLALEIVLK